MMSKYEKETIVSKEIESSSSPPKGNKEGRAAPPGTTVGQDIISLLIKIVIILLIFAALFTWVFGIYRNGNIYMSPAVKDGDLVIYYRIDKMFAASDLAVLEYDGKLQTERVIAVAGDTVDITDAGLLINGSLQQNLDIYEQTYRFDGGADFPVTVGEDEVFLLGDKRTVATDSRVYGCVDIKDLKGKVIGIIRRRNL